MDIKAANVCKAPNEEHKTQAGSLTLKQVYSSNLRPEIQSWSVSQYQGPVWGALEIRWELTGQSQFGDINIDRYLLRHSQYLEMPLLHTQKGETRRPSGAYIH